MHEKNFVDIIRQEFDAIEVPIHHIEITGSSRDRYMGQMMPSSYMNVHPLYTMDFMIQVPSEDQIYFRRFARKMEAREEPYISFDDMHARLKHNGIDMPLEFNKRIICDIYISVELEEAYVYNFLKTLREETQPIRERIYSKNFDKEVEAHLSDDEYNKDDGHQ